MEKDKALEIAYDAQNMSFEELFVAYAEFQRIVNNTPNHFPSKSKEWQEGLHAIQGLVTESGELMDAYKKEMYGKQKPLSIDNIREECGDVFYYLHALVKAYGFTFKDIIKDNVVKLANRYIEKFEV